jgi:hypothetical protein
MSIPLKELAAMAASSLIVAGAAAQSAKDIRGPSPLVAIENEAPPKLIVDPPLAEQLSRGLVFIQYRTENARIMPVFGKGALEVSPRLGHVHITVDDAPWHFVDASGETIVVVGLPPGPHKVLVELADPTHKVITGETVKFTVPDTKPDSRGSDDDRRERYEPSKRKPGFATSLLPLLCRGCNVRGRWRMAFASRDVCGGAWSRELD